MTIDGPKAVAPEEFRSAMELVDATFRPGQPGGMEKHFPLMLCRENAGHLRVFTDDGRVVAFVGMFVRDVRLGGSLHRTCCIGAVCTDPQYRGRGLGTRLMDDAVTTALADRVDLFLISGTRGLYTRLGYVCVGAYPVYSIEAARLPADGPYVLRPWQPEDLPALVGLHAAEPVRFVRTPSDFLALLRCGLVCDAPGDTELVCRRSTGRPVAYLSYQVGGRHKAADALTAVEMAGSRWAVAHGLRLLLTKRNAAGLHLRAMGSDCEAAELAGLPGDGRHRGPRAVLERLCGGFRRTPRPGARRPPPPGHGGRAVRPLWRRIAAPGRHDGADRTGVPGARPARGPASGARERTARGAGRVVPAAAGRLWPELHLSSLSRAGPLG